MNENSNQNLFWARLAALQRQPLAPLSVNQLNGSRMVSSTASQQHSSPAPALQLFPTPRSVSSAVGAIASPSPGSPDLWNLASSLLKEKTDLQLENERLRSQLRMAAPSLSERGGNNAETSQLLRNQQVRKRQRLEDCSSEGARKKLKARAALDIKTFCEERFPDGVYGELSAAAFGLVLENCPDEKTQDFLVNAASNVRIHHPFVTLCCDAELLVAYIDAYI